MNSQESEWLIRNLIQVNQRLKEALTARGTKVNVEVTYMPEKAPEGKTWQCVHCGHHSDDPATQTIPGLCEHEVILVDKSTLAPAETP